MVVANGRLTSSPGPMATKTPIEQVRAALASGRLGMYFGEPTVMWVSNYYHGFLRGLAAVNRAEWLREEEQLRTFETWLRARYGHEAPSWHELIRAYEGPCESGIKRFTELWDEFESDGAS